MGERWGFASNPAKNLKFLDFPYHKRTRFGTSVLNCRPNFVDSLGHVVVDAILKGEL